MKFFNKLLSTLLVVLLLPNISQAMEQESEEFTEGGNQEVSLLKELATSAVIANLANNHAWLEEVEQRVPAELLEFIKSKIAVYYFPLLVQILSSKRKTLIGHETPVTAVRLNETLNCALTGSEDGDVRLWDLSEGKCITVFQGHASKITALAFDEEGKYIASGSEDGNVRVWDIEKGTCVHDITQHMKKGPPALHRFYTIVTIKFIEGQCLEFGNVMHSVLWHLPTDKRIFMERNITLDSNSANYSIFIPEGGYFGIGDINIIKRKNFSLEEALKIPKNKDEVICTLRQPNRITCGKISPNDQLVMIGSGGSATLWDIKTGECIETFQEEQLESCIWVVDFSEDCKKVFIVASNNSDTLHIKVWDIEKREQVRKNSFYLDSMANTVPIKIIAYDENDFNIIFADKTQMEIWSEENYKTISCRKSCSFQNLINDTYNFNVATYEEGGAAIYCRPIFYAELDMDKDISQSFDLGFYNNTLTALFGIGNNCQLWTLLNDLSLKQLIFIVALFKQRRTNQEMIYDQELLKSFDLEQQLSLMKYFDKKSDLDCEKID